MIFLPLLYMPCEFLDGKTDDYDIENESDESLVSERGMIVGMALSCHVCVLLIGLSLF